MPRKRPDRMEVRLDADTQRRLEQLGRVLPVARADLVRLALKRWADHIDRQGGVSSVHDPDDD